ncbi:hypothetical protein GCM10023065_25380 [Microbacterium laevaniformans]|uniref:GTP-binding protein n=1 Tax=Microbacterium laevaniformans TaxID=36807 RepID=UPI00195D442B|nr:GTP-binding protein [Microbacterium laevaniformans]MBM7753497.1 G3E family GTPase [Microbacterium laevaniformans]GLJ65613.1 hypothetical protein GCM10017578_25020 [Microbacterium laevaniformans]
MLPSPLIVAGLCTPERRRYAAGLAVATRRGLLRVSAGREDADAGAAPSDPVAVTLERDRHDVERFVIDADIDVDVLHLDIVTRTPPAPIVCVVDARHMLDDLRDPSPLDGRRRNGDGDAGARARRAVTLLESATLISLVRWEHVETAELPVLMALASHLAPRGRVRLSRGPAEDLQALAGSDPRGFDESSVLERPGWVQALNDEHDPYMTDPRVSTVRYERLRPFHPARLAAALDELDTGRFGLLLRSAGFCRLATRPGILARWNQVGSAMWIDPQDASMEASLTAQDLALTGLDLMTGAVVATLDAALLTDAELEQGAAGWARLEDPLPAWPVFADDTLPHDPLA